MSGKHDDGGVQPYYSINSTRRASRVSITAIKEHFFFFFFLLFMSEYTALHVLEVCMVTLIARVMDRPGKVASPARGQLNRKNECFPVRVQFVPENLVSQDWFGSPVPRQPAHLHTQTESGAYLRYSSRVPRRRLFIHF